MPTASIILPVYRSETTLERSLESLRGQTFRDFEAIVIDSSPDSRCERIMNERFPEYRYVHHPERLDSDEARNLGFEISTCALIVAMDPDVYSKPNWLAELVAAHNTHGGLVIGGIACYGDRWLDQGAHLCKFDKWLAESSSHELKDGPSANMLISRQLIEQAEGFMRNNHGDTDLCWRVRRSGGILRFAPGAIVHHHHLHTWGSLLRERYERGLGFGELWLAWNRVSRARLVWRLLVSILPIRLMSQLLRVGRNARSAQMLGTYVRTIPIVVSGLYAWLLGEAFLFVTRISQSSRSS